MDQSGLVSPCGTFRLLRIFATVNIVADEGGDLGRPRPGINPRDLRVSDAEREHVASLLHRALARGLIDLDGFSSRVATALAARTRAELNAVLVDLPGVVVRVDPNGRGG
jgi:hypothetical protein